MLAFICLLILAYTIVGEPVGRLVDRLNDIDWRERAASIGNSLKSFGIKAGRTTCKPLLYFWYVMREEETSLTDRALIYGAILYIISPFDLIPRRVLVLFGIMDDLAVSAFVLKKISDRITPEIEEAVHQTLDEWFGVKDEEESVIVS